MVVARPTKLNKKRQDVIVRAIQDGVNKKNAAALAGIEYDTFNNWMKRGEDEGKGPYFKFFGLVTLAEAQCIADCEKSIKNAGVVKGDWRAAVEYLERRDPDIWVKQNKLQISGSAEIFLKWDENADDNDPPAEDAPGAGGDIPSPGTV